MKVLGSHGIYILYVVGTHKISQFVPSHPIPTTMKNHEAYGQVCDIKKVLQLWVSRRCVNGGGNMWVFPDIGIPQNGWFILENPILRWMTWGYPILGNLHVETVMNDFGLNKNEGLGGGNSNIFYFHHYLGKIPILTSIFQRG